MLIDCFPKYCSFNCFCVNWCLWENVFKYWREGGDGGNLNRQWRLNGLSGRLAHNLLTFRTTPQHTPAQIPQVGSTNIDTIAVCGGFSRLPHNLVTFMPPQPKMQKKPPPRCAQWPGSAAVFVACIELGDPGSGGRKSFQRNTKRSVCLDVSPLHCSNHKQDIYQRNPPFGHFLLQAVEWLTVDWPFWS